MMNDQQKEKLVIDLAVHGNTKIYDVFKKLGFNDVHSVIYEILEDKDKLQRIDELTKRSLGAAVFYESVKSILKE